MSTETAMLRAELLMLKTRYDYYAFSPAIYAVVKSIETEVSWIEQKLWVRRAVAPHHPILLAGSRGVSPTARGEKSQWVS
jgi:hypothetical protein